MPELHPNVQEALKALSRAQDAYKHATAQIETQYLKALDDAYSDQAEMVRGLFTTHGLIDLAGDSVKPRFS